MYPIVLIAVSVLFAAITWRDLRLGLSLIAAALPTYLLRFLIGPIPMTLLEVLSLILVATWIVERSKGGHLVPPGWGLPLVLLLVAATISVLVAPDKISALGIWKAYFVEPMLVFVVAVDAFGKLKETRYKIEDGLLVAICLGGLFVAICAIVQTVTSLGIPAPWDVEGRVVSIFPYPNAVGLYLAPVIVMAALQAGRRETRRIVRLGWAATAIVSTIAIFLSQSEAAIVAVVATFLVIGFVTKKTRIASVGIAILAIIAVLVFPPLCDKMTFNDYSGQVRRSQWRETILMLADHPAFGAGLNGYPATMSAYHTDEQYEIFQYPHTLVLNVWTELGALGLVAFVMIAWRVVVTVRRGVDVVGRGAGLSGSAGDPPMAVTMAFLALLAMTIHGLADVSYFKNDLAMMTWLLLAVIAASSYVPTDDKRT